MDKARSSVSVFIGIFTAATLQHFDPKAGFFMTVGVYFVAYIVADIVDTVRSQRQNGEW